MFSQEAFRFATFGALEIVRSVKIWFSGEVSVQSASKMLQVSCGPVGFVSASVVFMTCAQALKTSGFQRRIAARRVMMSVEDNVEAWNAFVDYNARVGWRGRARSFSIDPILRRARVDGVLDGKRYVTRFEVSGSGPGFQEVRDWDDWDVEQSSSGRDFSSDFDGSYSIDYNVHSMGSATSRFAAETGFAVSDDERVRVFAAYDVSGGLCRVTVLEETKIGASSCAGAKRSECSDLFDLAGDWPGDATVRRRKGALAVAKQDMSFSTDGDRLVRRLTVADLTGSFLNSFESYGQAAPSRPTGAEFVTMDDGYAMLLVLDAAAFVLAPLSVFDRNAFYVEAGLFVEELPNSVATQFPISIRNGELPQDAGMQDGLGSSQRPRRHLSRSVRLYSNDGSLSSVTTSYHQLSARPLA